MNITRIYHLLFYKFYCFFSATAKEGWEEWKALILINILGVLFVAELMVWADILINMKTVSFEPYWIAIPISFGVAWFNYSFFIQKNAWKKYAKEFENHSQSSNRLASWLTLLFVIFFFLTLVFSFYSLSQSTQKNNL